MLAGEQRIPQKPIGKVTRRPKPVVFGFFLSDPYIAIYIAEVSQVGLHCNKGMVWYTSWWFRVSSL